MLDFCRGCACSVLAFSLFMLGRGMPSSRDDQWFPLAAVGLFFFNFMLGGGTPSISQLQGRGMPSSRDDATTN